MVLYTTHCPMCRVLKKKLDEANIDYTECDDIDIMKSKNIVSVPQLETDDGIIMDFTKAIAWINRG